MKHLRDPADVAGIEDATLRALIAQRFEDFCQGEPYDPDLHAQVILVEAGDALGTIEAAGGCAITREPFSARGYGEPGFRPGFEVLEEHDTCFELVYVENDGGQGVVFIIPKQAGIDDTLTRFCAEYATPAPDLKVA